MKSNSLILPSLHKDMTFFSWMSTTQVLNGAISGYRLSQVLMQNGSAGCRLDFPSHLDAFCRSTSYAFGHPEDIALGHTSLPYFLAFRRQSLTGECIQVMQGDSVETLKFKLGIAPAHYRDSSDLKFCPACRDEDMDTLGYSYWHREHQLPSAHLCHKHSTGLWTIPFRSVGLQKNAFIVPSRAVIEQAISPLNKASVLKAITDISNHLLVDQLPGGFDALQLHFTYQHGLREQGLLTKAGRIRVEDFLERFEQYFRQLKQIHPYQRLLLADNIPHFLKLIRKPRGHHLTLAHILLIEFLFGNWELFSATYAWERQFQLDLQIRGEEEHSLHAVDDRLIVIAQQYNNGASLRSLASQYCYDIQTLMRLLEKSGLAQIKKRPKVLTSEKVAEVLRLLEAGKPLVEVQSLTQLSKSSIDRILNSQPDIKTAWQESKFKNSLELRRQQFCEVRKQYPEYSANEIRGEILTSYKWLLKHDLSWLKSQLALLPKGRLVRTKSPSKDRIDWVKRDQICLSALMQLDVFIIDSWERQTPNIFLRRLPTLNFTPRLERLPLSKKWISEKLVMLQTNSIEKFDLRVGGSG